MRNRFGRATMLLSPFIVVGLREALAFAPPRNPTFVTVKRSLPKLLVKTFDGNTPTPPDSIDPNGCQSVSDPTRIVQKLSLTANVAYALSSVPAHAAGPDWGKYHIRTQFHRERQEFISSPKSLTNAIFLLSIRLV